MSVETEFMIAFTDLNLKLKKEGDYQGAAILDKLMQDNIMLHTKVKELLDEQEKARIAAK